MPATAQRPAPQPNSGQPNSGQPTSRWTKLTAISTASPDAVDRMLLGLCAVIWLAFVGMLVGAIVVMVDRGADSGPSDSGSSWGIYIVMGVSLAVIVGAIPLLLRARRMASAGSSAAKGVDAARVAQQSAAAAQSSVAQSAARPPEAATEKLRVFGSVADPVTNAPAIPQNYSGPGSPAYRAAQAVAENLTVANRVWLRTVLGMTGAIGLALLAVATGTYLLVVDQGTWAIVAFVVAGVVTCAMVAIPWLSLKRLRELGTTTA